MTSTVSAAVDGAGFTVLLLTATIETANVPAPRRLVKSRPNIDPAGVVVSNALNAPGFPLNHVNGSPMAKSPNVVAVRPLICSHRFVPGVAVHVAFNVVGNQLAPSQR